MVFAQGQEVVWKSQSAGYTKVKVGKVVALVDRDVEPNRALAAAGARGTIKNPGMVRDHLSYVIRADGRLYWPRVSHLRPAVVAPNPCNECLSDDCRCGAADGIEPDDLFGREP